MEHGLIVNQKFVMRIMQDLQIHGLPRQKKCTQPRQHRDARGPGQSRFRCRSTQRPVADGQNRTPHAQSQGLLLLCARPLFTKDRGMGNRPTLRDGNRERRLINGAPLENHVAQNGHSFHRLNSHNSRRGPSARTFVVTDCSGQWGRLAIATQFSDGVILGLHADLTARPSAVDHGRRTALRADRLRLHASHGVAGEDASENEVSRIAAFRRFSC